MLIRPRPPEDLLGGEGAVTETPVRPAPDLLDWMRATFIDQDALLVNEDHAHLREARLGVLWCAVPNARQGNAVVGMCETTAFMGNRWAKARFEQQVTGWFGAMPHFLLTFDAEYAALCDDATFCSLVEHELYHAGQERDPYGAPKFRKDGSPAFTIRGHDVEEFVGVVARYGTGAAAGQTAALVAAANRAPIICEAEIAGACGTCGRSLTGA
jgi:hypothetical protein